MSDSASPKPTPWFGIVVFVVLAISISLPFRWGLVEMSWLSATVLGVPVWRALLEGSGPIVATLIATRGFRRHWRPITFAGSSLPHAAAMLAVPCLVFLLIGIPGHDGVSPRLSGLVLGMTTVAYCVFEETGWRGYLQNALQSIPPVHRYTVIGMAWYAWHLPFLAENATLGTQAVFLAVLVGASFLLGRLADEMHSVFLAAAFHLIVNLLSFNRLLGGAALDRKLLLVVVCVALWIPILLHWKQYAMRPTGKPDATPEPMHGRGRGSPGDG
jgi:hypothetical protein